MGSLPCEPTYGGPIQLYRHFVESGDFDFHSIVEASVTSNNYLLAGFSGWNRIVQRFTNTRLYPHVFALNCLVGARRQLKRVLRKASRIQPQAIVTVAYGSYAFLAPAVARRLNLPLITFFHDWWPDLTPSSGISKRLLDNRFRALYRQSDLALCVCEQMRNELGPHKNAIVLQPIPAFKRPVHQPTDVGKTKKQFCLVYLGTLQGRYGGSMRNLTAFLINSPCDTLDLKVYGPATDWPEDALRAAQRSGIYLGAKHGAAAAEALQGADAFLIVMNFDAVDRRRVRSSFPSKLLESIVPTANQSSSGDRNTVGRPVSESQQRCVRNNRSLTGKIRIVGGGPLC